jgi:hypothetical protein
MLVACPLEGLVGRTVKGRGEISGKTNICGKIIP